MRVYTKLVLLSALFFLAACASAPEATPTLLPTATQTPAPTATPAPTSTSTPSPTPIGSGNYPLLAVVNSTDIKIIELETERILHTLPYIVSGDIALKLVSFSPDGTELAYNDGLDIQKYDLETGETTLLFSLPEGAFLEKIEWSSSQKWLSYSLYFDRETTSRLWVHNLESGRSTFISRGYYLNWLPNEDRFIYQNAGGGKLIHNPTNGVEAAVPSSTRGSRAIESHSVQFAGSYCQICYYPGFNAFEFAGYSKNEVFFHLINTENRTEKAFVAHFVSEFNFFDGFYVSFHNVLPLNRGDYIVYITARVGQSPDTVSTTYAIWDPEGTLPIEISFENDANRLANVMPVQLSADETVFIGLRPSEVVVVDIATAEILYSYPVGFLWSNRTTGYTPSGIDLYWGD